MSGKIYQADLFRLAGGGGEGECGDGWLDGGVGLGVGVVDELSEVIGCPSNFHQACVVTSRWRMMCLTFAKIDVLPPSVGPTSTTVAGPVRFLDLLLLPRYPERLVQSPFHFHR